MKPWYKSKIVWVNVISILLEVSQILTGVNWIPTGTLTLVVNILNIILRKLTTQPLGKETNDVL
jgi:hypothetical protein